MHKKLARIGAALLSLSAVAPLAHSASEIKIGFLTTLSGPGGALGADVRDGFQLAITHSGQKLGGLPVQMNVVDDQQNPQTGRQSVERFLKRDKVDLVTGVVFSNVLLPVLKNVRDARKGPILVHVVTKKGKGYAPAEAAADCC